MIENKVRRPDRHMVRLFERLCESLAAGGLPPFDSCGVLGPFAGDVVGRPGLVKTSALLYVGGLE